MTNKELVTAFFEEGYTNRNYDFILDCVAENYMDHSPAGARSNRDAAGILRIVADQFSGLRAEVLDVFAEGSMVAVRVRFTGVHTGECMAFLPPGKRYPLKHWRISVYRKAKSWRPGDIGRISRSMPC